MYGGNSQHPLETPTALSLFAVAALSLSGITMIDAHVGIGIILCAFGVTLSLWLYWKAFKVMKMKDFSTWPKVGVVAIIVQIVIPGLLLVSKSDEAKPPSAGGNGDCNTSVGRDNFGNINPDCRKYFGPPKQNNGLYQNGERVGTVGGTKKVGSRIVLINPRLDTGSLNVNQALGLGEENVQISCPALVSMFNPNAGHAMAMVAGEVECELEK